MAKKKLFPKIDTSNMLISESGEVLDKEKYMADKKADTINTCWICGRKFLATHIMEDPVCPACEKNKIKKVDSKHNDSLLPQIEAQLYAKSLESPWGDLPPT